MAVPAIAPCSLNYCFFLSISNPNNDTNISEAIFTRKQLYHKVRKTLQALWCISASPDLVHKQLHVFRFIMVIKFKGPYLVVLLRANLHKHPEAQKNSDRPQLPQAPEQIKIPDQALARAEKGDRLISSLLCCYCSTSEQYCPVWDRLLYHLTN